MTIFSERHTLAPAKTQGVQRIRFLFLVRTASVQATAIFGRNSIFLLNSFLNKRPDLEQIMSCFATGRTDRKCLHSSVK